MSDEHTDEWHEGYVAFLAGRNESENPYPNGSVTRLSWEDGYERAYLDWSELIGA